MLGDFSCKIPAWGSCLKRHAPPRRGPPTRHGRVVALAIVVYARAERCTCRVLACVARFAWQDIGSMNAVQPGGKERMISLVEAASTKR